MDLASAHTAARALILSLRDGVERLEKAEAVRFLSVIASAKAKRTKWHALFSSTSKKTMETGVNNLVVVVVVVGVVEKHSRGAPCCLFPVGRSLLCIASFP